MIDNSLKLGVRNTEVILELSEMLPLVIEESQVDLLLLVSSGQYLGVSQMTVFIKHALVARKSVALLVHVGKGLQVVVKSEASKGNIKTFLGKAESVSILCAQ